jgi:hypothetical protein
MFSINESVNKYVKKKFIHNISSFYVLDDKRELIFSYNSVDETSDIMDDNLMSGFITAVTSFIKEALKDNLFQVSLGDKKVFSINDNISNFLFILVCDKDAKYKKIKPIINNLKNLYLNKCTGIQYIREQRKIQSINQFHEAVNQILFPTSAESFLGSF